jgi:iron-sulfur cluster repair protein YtfE (RIC family)
MNALQLLKEDHDRVDGLFQKVKANEDGDNLQVAEQISLELQAHAHIEESIFYPALMENGDEELQKITREGIEEHREVHTLLGELAGRKEWNEELQAKLTVLMENVEHHVQEEEGEMFPLIRDQFDEELLADLAIEMQEEKGVFQKSMAASGK